MTFEAKTATQALIDELDAVGFDAAPDTETPIVERHMDAAPVRQHGRSLPVRAVPQHARRPVLHRTQRAENNKPRRAKVTEPKTIKIDEVEYVRADSVLDPNRPPSKAAVVEVPLPDGWMSMYVGRLIERDESRIILTDAAWVSSTGRRSEFFAGRYDGNCEIEPCPDGVRVDLPASGAVVTDWPHDLPRAVR